MELLKRLVVEEEGQGMAEYALILAGVAVLVMGAVYVLGGSIKTKFQAVSDKLDSK